MTVGSSRDFPNTIPTSLPLQSNTPAPLKPSLKIWFGVMRKITVSLQKLSFGYKSMPSPIYDARKHSIGEELAPNINSASSSSG